LLADDEEIVHQTIADYLRDAGCQVDGVWEGGAAVQALKAAEYDLALIDMRMPELDGLEVLAWCQEMKPELSVVIITGHGNMEVAVQALRLGAADFLCKPIRLLELDGVLAKVARLHRLHRDHRRLRGAIRSMQAAEHLRDQPLFVGQSRALRQVQADLAQVALTDLTVLIQGETGTGKGLAARAIHGQSPRRTGPFIPVNCGAIPKELVESELFGHERGAFTGAVSRKLGKFELAEGGTLFLDEIGDLPLGSQTALLQLLQEQTFQRVGGRKVLRGEARIIAATNRDLEAAVERGEFRKDLFYRLNGFAVELPPLRQRREDIPLLVEYFAGEFARHLDRPTPALDPEVVEYLQAYDWPGNVRELEHLVQRAVLVCKEGIIRREDLAVPPSPFGGEDAPVDGTLEAMLQGGDGSSGGDLLERAEEVVLRLALTRTQGNKSQAAALLRTDRKKVERRARKYRIGE
ncbi:MAG: sigma-54-dependent Fis family transcriptional regulator, partial [Candidatus Latescibacteria bacterium]|nr:sigma-54-dependent Fis family transcriptional regulator [Candidatus Latescibacterota bacterium]